MCFKLENGFLLISVFYEYITVLFLTCLWIVVVNFSWFVSGKIVGKGGLYIWSACMLLLAWCTCVIILHHCWSSQLILLHSVELAFSRLLSLRWQSILCFISEDACVFILPWYEKLAISPQLLLHQSEISFYCKSYVDFRMMIIRFGEFWLFVNPFMFWASCCFFIVSALKMNSSLWLVAM